MCFPASLFAARAYYEEVEQPGWFTFSRPAESNPEDQLSHAEQLRDEGRLRKAAKQFRHLVRYWPQSPAAADAQYRYAQVLHERGKLGQAFEAFEHLLEEYTGMIPHDTVLEEMLVIAEAVRDRRRGQFFFFPGFESPERAIPLLETIITNGPQWERAPEVQLMIGDIQMELDRLEEAIRSYDRVQSNYPRSPEAQEAVFAKARALYQLVEEFPRDLEGIEMALYAAAQYVRQYPDSPRRSEAIEYMESLRDRLAHAEFKKAVFYDKKAKKPEAALIVYEQFLQQFPDTRWADEARARTHQLQEKTKDTHE